MLPRSYVKLLLIFTTLLFVTISVADVLEFSEDATVEELFLGIRNGLKIKTVQKYEHEQFDYYYVQVTVFWSTSNNKGSEVLFDGISAGSQEIMRIKNKVILKQWGNRFASEGWYMETPFTWNPNSKTFEKGEPVEVDPWEINRNRLKGLLEEGNFEEAFKLAKGMGSSPNGGHNFETESLFQLFVDAAHAHGLKLSKQGDTKKSAAILKQLLFERLYYSWHNFDTTLTHFTIWPQTSEENRRDDSEPFFYLQATSKHILMINDFAYWLLEGGEPEVAKQLLEQIISITPERKAAWLNLADAQYETKEFPWDEQTVESYETYIRLMYAKGLEKLIPDRVYIRIFIIKSNPEYKTNTN